MPRSYSSYSSKPASLKGFQVTGGPVTKAGTLASGDNLSGPFSSFRQKSSSINDIPGLICSWEPLNMQRIKKLI